jgi:hypothetical protein
MLFALCLKLYAFLSHEMAHMVALGFNPKRKAIIVMSDPSSVAYPLNAKQPGRFAF